MIEFNCILTFLLILIKHDITYVFNVGEVLCFKAFNEIINNFFFYPNKNQSIFHDWCWDFKIVLKIWDRNPVLTLFGCCWSIWQWVCAVPWWIDKYCLDVMSIFWIVYWFDPIFALKGYCFGQTIWNLCLLEIDISFPRHDQIKYTYTFRHLSLFTSLHCLFCSPFRNLLSSLYFPFNFSSSFFDCSCWFSSLFWIIIIIRIIISIIEIWIKLLESRSLSKLSLREWVAFFFLLQCVFGLHFKKIYEINKTISQYLQFQWLVHHFFLICSSTMNILVFLLLYTRSFLDDHHWMTVVHHYDLLECKYL